MLTAGQAVGICEALEGAGVRYWLIGGWGVDALLGRETRAHKDLDILALIDDLPRLRRMFRENGFATSHLWEENRWTDDDGARWPTAFVAADAAGRELDVHLIGLHADGSVVQHYDNPWPLPKPFAANGTIAGMVVPCVSREAQERMHTGYVVPDEQQADLQRLREAASIELRTEHLILRPMPPTAAALLPGDRQGVRAILGVAPDEEWPLPDILDLMPIHALRSPSEEALGIWVMIEPATNTVVGDIGFLDLPDANGEMEMGYSVVPSRRRRGYATEAASALMAWALVQPGVNALVAGTDADNLASQRVLARAGFTQTSSSPSEVRWRIERGALRT